MQAESVFHNQSCNTEEKLGQRRDACPAAAACKAALQLFSDTRVSVSYADPVSLCGVRVTSQP